MTTNPNYRPPGFIFYVDDWLASETNTIMPLEFQAAYVRLLCHQWANESCTLPADDESLAQLSGLKELFPKYEAKLKQKFIILEKTQNRRANIRLLNQRLEAYQAYLSKSKPGRMGGKASAKSRAYKSKQKIISLKANAKQISTDSDSDSDSDIDKSTNVDLSSTKKIKFPKNWPPPGEELKPYVYLTTEQRDSLLKTFTRKELWYWILELSNAAQQNENLWMKKYSNHKLVIMNWRKMKLEKGLIWDERKQLYQYPSRYNTKGTAQIEKSLSLIDKLKKDEDEDEEK